MLTAAVWESLNVLTFILNLLTKPLLQMLAVNLFALHRARGHIFLAENDKQKEKQEVKTERYLSNQKQAKSLVLDLMAGSLSALLLPVYTIRESEALLEYFALPASMLNEHSTSQSHRLFNQFYYLCLFYWNLQLNLPWIGFNLILKY